MPAHDLSACPRRRGRSPFPALAAVAATVALTAATASPAAAEAREPAPASRAEIQRALDAMVAAGAPGVTARITDENGTWTATSGVADLDSGTPMPANGAFRPASVTKSLVATVVLQLEDEDALSLDDTLGELLPGTVPGGDGVTVNRLLNHTSGLPDYIEDPLFEDPEDYTRRGFTPEELVEIADRQDPSAEPGEFAYSNTNYVLLGMIVEELTGNTLGDELGDRVLRPAGMDRSYLPVRETGLPGEHASGYYRLAGRQDLTEATEIDPSFAWAAYGLVSTPEDVAGFYRALWDGDLLPAASLAKMREMVPGPNFFMSGYGLGLERMDLTCTSPEGHTGSIPGFSTFAFLTGDGDRQVTVSANAFLLDASATPMILAALDVLNLGLCGEPFTPPQAMEQAGPLAPA
ncbi:serine hydrolase domain-containing protein [Nocardiopsis mangrovi]|uniref:Serine hydrolase domain-containing protein n=1 Tax=Nocardiopsis mangrovi TaxID=1179818 RepID=A0ABV9E6Q7_9ACTN